MTFVQVMPRDSSKIQRLFASALGTEFVAQHSFAYLNSLAPIRAHFGSSRPFSLLVAGKVFYIVSDPKDTGAVLRNTKTLQFDGFVDDMLHQLGMSDDGVKTLWATQDNEEATYHNDPVLMTNSHDFYRDHLAPGPDMNAVGSRYLNYLDQHVDEAVLGSGETWSEGKVKDISLYTWARDFMSTAITDALFGPLLIETTPNFIETLWVFDSTFWKVIYQLPKLFAKEAHDAKKGMAESFMKFFAVYHKSESRKSEALDIITGRYKMLKAGGMSDWDVGVATVAVTLGSVVLLPIRLIRS
jgi:hypothetical protein